MSVYKDVLNLNAVSPLSGRKISNKGRRELYVFIYLLTYYCSTRKIALIKQMNTLILKTAWECQVLLFPTFIFIIIITIIN